MAVIREVKEGRITSFQDPDTAVVAINGSEDIIIFDPGVQLRHPNPPNNVYFLEVIINTPNGTKIIHRDIRKR